MSDTTYIESEDACYPSGGFLRRGRARLVEDIHNPLGLPYGEVRAVRASIAHTYFTIPARLRHGGRTIRGFLSRHDEELTFTPEADPATCTHCEPGKGCKE